MGKVYQTPGFKLNDFPKAHLRHDDKIRCRHCGVTVDYIEANNEDDLIIYDDVEFKTIISNIQIYGYVPCVHMTKIDK